MSEIPHGEQSVARQLFTAHFSSLLDEANYKRTLHIFDEVGAHNERSLAIQFHTAQAVGKLDAVLAAYEKIMDPEAGFMHLVPDEITRAVEVRRLADIIYLSVIAEGNPMNLFALREQIDIPEIFDLMSERL